MNFKIKRQNNLHAFTLVELIVTITIMAIVLTVLTGVLTSVVKAQLRTQALSEVKRNGDSVVGQIQEAVRTSKEVSVSVNQIRFTNQNDDDYTIGFVGPTNTSCVAGAANGYMYMVKGAVGPLSDADKITNDNLTTGVNVASFSVSLDSSSLTPKIDIDLKVDKGLCSQYSESDVGRSFKSTVTARAFFNGP